MEAPNALPAGHALQEYRIEKLLGVGGFGLTYLALDENLHLRVAVKEYLPADIAARASDRTIAPRSDESAEIFDWGRRRFLDESRTLASFRHPNIVRVMRFFEANGTAYMVMEFVEGAPLPDWVGVRRPLAGVLYWMVTGNSPHEAAARIRADTMPPALQAADKSLFRPEFLAAIDWALAPDEDQRPQSVPEWREALLGAAPTPPRTQVAQPRTQVQKTPLQPTTIPATFDPTLLKRLEAELAQHLGPIAPAVVRNAARKAATQEELVQMLAADISASIPRAAFQRQFSEISRPVSKPPAPAASGPAVPPTALAASRFPQEVLDRATARLAEYIGALSRVVVKRAAIKARDEAELYLLIADEIEDPARKKAFIRRAISASGKP